VCRKPNHRGASQHSLSGRFCVIIAFNRLFMHAQSYQKLTCYFRFLQASKTAHRGLLETHV